jgi:hypothetical protein
VNRPPSHFGAMRCKVAHVGVVDQHAIVEALRRQRARALANREPTNEVASASRGAVDFAKQQRRVSDAFGLNVVRQQTALVRVFTGVRMLAPMHTARPSAARPRRLPRKRSRRIARVATRAASRRSARRRRRDDTEPADVVDEGRRL